MSTSSAEAKSKRLNVGIVGCGRVAHHHLKFLVKRPDVHVCGLVDRDADHAQRLAEEFGVPHVYKRVEDLFSAGRVDVTHVLTPPRFHVEHASCAITAGSHVLIEKPVAPTVAETEQLYREAETQGVTLCPDFIHLYNPIVLVAQRAVDRHDLGELLHASCFMSINLDTPELRECPGLHWSYELPGGILENYITHPLYMVLNGIGGLRNITTSPRVFGSLAQGVTDQVDLLLEGEHCNGSITLTFAPKHQTYTLSLFYEKGTVTVDFITQTHTVERKSRLPGAVTRVSSNIGKSRQLVFRTIGNVINFALGRFVPYGGLQHLIDAYYEKINTGSPPPISKELTVAVSAAEERIREKSGKVFFDTFPKPATRAEHTKEQSVLVTGASGYVGREVVREFVESGYAVRAFVRKSSHIDALESLGVEIHAGDIRDPKAVRTAAEGVDAIVHLAAALQGSQEYILAASIKGVENVAAAARATHASRVIYVSSFSVFDYLKLKNGDTITENSPLEPEPESRGAYSWAKVEAERPAVAALREESPAWTVLRPSLIFGRHGDASTVAGPRLGRWLLALGGRHKHLRLIHVTDVARAIRIALDNEGTQQRIFNLSHTDAVTVEDVMRNCFLTDRLQRVRALPIPTFVGAIARPLLAMVRFLLRRGPNLTRARWAYVTRDLTADSSAFRKATGWEPGAPLLEQLRREIELPADESSATPDLKEAVRVVEETSL